MVGTGRTAYRCGCSVRGDGRSGPAGPDRHRRVHRPPPLTACGPHRGHPAGATSGDSCDRKRFALSSAPTSGRAGRFPAFALRGDAGCCTVVAAVTAVVICITPRGVRPHSALSVTRCATRSRRTGVGQGPYAVPSPQAAKGSCDRGHSRGMPGSHPSGVTRTTELRPHTPGRGRRGFMMPACRTGFQAAAVNAARADLRNCRRG